MDAQGEPVVVARQGSLLIAYENRCPHRGTSLEWLPHRFMSVDGRHLQCSTHGALFRVEDGLCVYGPCQGQSLRPLALEHSAGLVWLVTAERDA